MEKTKNITADGAALCPVTLSDVESRIVTVRGERVILDSDVAAMYGVETRQVNQAVKRNRNRFPEGYVFELAKEEWAGLVTNCDKSGQRNYPGKPKAFTEKGLYMLATILKSPQAADDKGY